MNHRFNTEYLPSRTADDSTWLLRFSLASAALIAILTVING